MIHANGLTRLVASGKIHLIDPISVEPAGLSPRPVGTGNGRNDGRHLRRQTVRAKYLLPCPCGEKIAVEASQAGQEIRCRCGAALEVPTMRGLAQLERAGPKPAVGRSTATPQTGQASDVPPAAGRSTIRGSTSVWGTRQRLVLVGGFITVLGLGSAIVLYAGRPRLLDLERYPPIGTWQLWHDLRQGIEQRPAWEEQYTRSVAGYHRWMVVASAIAGIGVLLMASPLLVRKRRSRGRVRRPPAKPRASEGKAGS